MKEPVSLPETRKPRRRNPYVEIKMSHSIEKWMIVNLISTDGAQRRDFSDVDKNGTS